MATGQGRMFLLLLVLGLLQVARSDVVETLNDPTQLDTSLDENDATSVADETVPDDQTDKVVPLESKLAEDATSVADETVPDDETDKAAPLESELADDATRVADETVPDDETDKAAPLESKLADDATSVADETVPDDRTDKVVPLESELADDAMIVNDETAPADETDTTVPLESDLADPADATSVDDTADLPLDSEIADPAVFNHAGEYEVWYRGGRRKTNMVISCDNSVEQPGIFTDKLHSDNVKGKCDLKRDAGSQFYILKSHGANKYECLKQSGTSLVGSHYTGPDQYWGTVEYRLIKKTSCKGSGFVRVGCWKDTGNRAIATLEGKDKRLDGNYQRRADAIKKCYEAAKSQSYEYFAVQNGGWCAGGNGLSYRKYGVASNCANGKGGAWANDVYRIKPSDRSLKVRKTCARPPSGCRVSWDRYQNVDCDGDGILDHVCHTTINENRWMVLSSEGCPNNWGTHDRKKSQCLQAFSADDDELADRICKGKCSHLKNSCGKMLGCGDKQFDVSKHCPTTCAGADDDELADRICKGKCSDLKTSCGKMLGCGDHQFDVSKHCPATCAGGSSEWAVGDGMHKFGEMVFYPFQSKEVCYKHCSLLKATNSRIDGVTFGRRGGSRARECWCEEGFTGVDTDPNMKAIWITRSITWVNGDGVGKSEVRVADYASAEKCYENCVKMKAKRPRINGATYGRMGGGREKQCWCEEGMTGMDTTKRLADRWMTRTMPSRLRYY